MKKKFLITSFAVAAECSIHRPGFPSLCSTDEYVYGVFINGKNPDDFNNISVFDWEGNEVATYETDCNVLRICCDDNRELRLGELK